MVSVMFYVTGAGNSPTFSPKTEKYPFSNNIQIYEKSGEHSDRTKSN